MKKEEKKNEKQEDEPLEYRRALYDDLRANLNAKCFRGEKIGAGARAVGL